MSASSREWLDNSVLAASHFATGRSGPKPTPAVDQDSLPMSATILSGCAMRIMSCSGPPTFCKLQQFSSGRFDRQQKK